MISAALVRDLPLDVLRMVDLAGRPWRGDHVLLLDELTAALTADQAERVFALLAEWKARRCCPHHPSPGRCVAGL
ncbi:MAG: hypothetical protein R2932_21120 [Caldilineaceae bacterium]